VSKIIIYGSTPEVRSALADKIANKTPNHHVVDGWDGIAPVEQNSIVLTEVAPPFVIALDYLVVGVGAHG
jgi:UDP-N-acetyl-D-mannosaminuronic acid transferase (WecB/TagA/CpsF family)